MESLPHDNISQLPVLRPVREPNRSSDIPGGDYLVRIPDGKYVAEFIGAEGYYYRGRSPKVVLWFWIAEGDQTGRMVPAYFNVKSLDCQRGQRARQPNFTACMTSAPMEQI